MSHRAALFFAYGAAVLVLAILMRVRPAFWQGREDRSDVTLGQRWLELALALLAVVGVLAVGQAWSAGYRLRADGALSTIAEALNQLAIFSPIVLLVWLRRRKAPSPWWRGDHAMLRLGLGIGCALLALLVYSFARGGTPSFGVLVRYTLRFEHIDELVQVALEDLSIAAIFVRLQAALRSRKLAIVLVAGLFAAAHVPAMLAGDASGREIAGLAVDAALGVLVISAAARAADLLWLVPVHFALDVSQRL